MKRFLIHIFAGFLLCGPAIAASGTLAWVGPAVTSPQSATQIGDEVELPKTEIVLINAQNGLVLDMSLDKPTGDRTPVYVFTRHDNANQKWKFVESGHGDYLILNAQSGLALDMSLDKAPGDRTEVYVFKRHDRENQRWKVIPSDKGGFFLINTKSGMALDMSMDKPAGNGTPVYCFQRHDQDNQRWLLGSESAQAGEKTKFDVILTSAGPSKLNVIQVVREVNSLGLKDAKDLVESAPKVVKAGISRNEAEEIRKKLVDAGASAEIK